MPLCQKCDIEFPNFMKISGKKRNLHKRKYCISCSPFGLHNTRTLHKKKTNFKMCSICKIEKHNSNFYKRRKNECSSYCKNCSAKVSKKARKEKREKMFEYAGSKCKVCNYDRCIDALEFHHLDPKEKEFGIAQMGNRSISVILKEIDKCILVCANCHREIHSDIL